MRPRRPNLPTALLLAASLITSLALAPASLADTIILYGPGELPPAPVERAASSADLPPLVRDAVLSPANVFIIPYYEVSTLDPTAEVALMSVRAEAPATPEIEFYPAAEADPIYLTKSVPLETREMWTANFREQLAGLPGVPNGVVTGWVSVISLAPVSVDSFQIFPGEAFATGENAFRFEDLCESWRVRFLLGGGFSGGTQLNFFSLDPLGGDSESDPPTFEGEAYGEDGEFINSFAIWTSENTRLTSAANLVLPGNSFGSIDVRVLSPNGGYATATHDASGLFSAGLKGYCLDPLLGD